MLAVSGATLATLAGCMSRGTVLAAETDSIHIGDGYAEMDGDPEEILLAIDGTWELDTTAEDPDRLRFTLMVEYDGVAEELDEDVIFGPDPSSEGTFGVSGDVLEHPDLDPAMFNDGAGSEVEKELTVIVVAQLIDNASIEAEVSVYEDALITIVQTGTMTGLGMSGSGEWDIE